MSRRKFLLCGSGALAFPSALAESQFPRPKFRFGQEVVVPWVDGEGVLHKDCGIVIGMMHDPTNYEIPGWWYLLRWTYMPSYSSVIGKDDGNFCPECRLKAFG